VKKLKYFIRNHFGFSSKEANGFIILSFLIILLLFSPFLVQTFYNPSSKIANEDGTLDSLIAILKSGQPKKFNKDLGTDELKTSLSFFNPNEADESKLVSVLGKKLAKTIVRFREKGGTFKVKNDLKKIYGVNEATYEKVKDYLLLPDTIAKPEFTNKKVTFASAIYFDINKADTTQLSKIKGIGSVLSLRILKYKNALGGFISKEQYQEIYGLDSMVILALKNQTFIQEGFVPNKINVNTAPYATLASHPYIGKKNSKSIQAYREQHSINSLEEIRLIKSISSSEITRMLPYLRF
jgi:DNA uptake protein ComE-like DNA-binding protein